MILVVEDSELTAKFLDSILSKKNHNVAIETDASKALEYFKGSDPVKLLIIDYRLGKMDAFEFVTKAREMYSGEFSTLVISGDSNPALKAKAKQLGILGWMDKPCDHNKLLQAVDLLLQAAG